VGVVLGVDGGNSKSDVVLASLEGEPLAWVRGPGSNSHAAGGAEACVAVIAALVERLPFAAPAEHGTFFLCGADVPEDVAELEAALGARAWSRTLTVDNDTFALLHAGSDGVDAIAIGCGSGLNCVGRNAEGRIARYPALGWETGDWGGADALGREALYHAARAEDRRGTPTSLSELVRSHFGRTTSLAVGEDVHYGRLPVSRLGELAPGVVAAAGEGDTVALGLVERLAAEVALLAARALTDLQLDDAEIVLGGGMLASGEGLLHELVVAALPEGARPVTSKVAPVAGAVTAMLDDGAARRFRKAFDEWRPDG